MTTNNDYTSIDTKYTMCNLCNRKLCKTSIRMHEKTKKHISNKVGHPPIENIPPDQDPTEENPNEEDISEVSIPTTPDIIELSPGEMFKDADGNPFHVEVVGVRGDRKNTWFKANKDKSISALFSTNPRWAGNTIQKNPIKYVYGEDYIFSRWTKNASTLKKILKNNNIYLMEPF